MDINSDHHSKPADVIHPKMKPALSPEEGVKSLEDVLREYELKTAGTEEKPCVPPKESFVAGGLASEGLMLTESASKEATAKEPTLMESLIDLSAAIQEDERRTAELEQLSSSKEPTPKEPAPKETTSEGPTSKGPSLKEPVPMGLLIDLTDDGMAAHDWLKAGPNQQSNTAKECVACKEPNPNKNMPMDLLVELSADERGGTTHSVIPEQLSVPKEPTFKEPTRQEPVCKEPIFKEPARKDTTFKEPARKEPAPKETTFKESARKEPAPKETTFKESARKEPAPKETTFKKPARKEPAPKETTFKEPARKEPAPKETAFKEPARKEPAPKETTFKKPARKEPAPKEATSEEAARKEPAFKEVSRKEAAPIEPARNETTRNEPIRNEPTRKEPARKEPTRKRHTRRQPYRNESTLKEPTLKEPTLKEPTLKEPTLKEPTRKEPAPKEPAFEEPAFKEPVFKEPTPMGTLVDLSLQESRTKVAPLPPMLHGIRHLFGVQRTYEKAVPVFSAIPALIPAKKYDYPSSTSVQGNKLAPEYSSASAPPHLRAPSENSSLTRSLSPVSSSLRSQSPPAPVNNGPAKPALGQSGRHYLKWADEVPDYSWNQGTQRGEEREW